MTLNAPRRNVTHRGRHHSGNYQWVHLRLGIVRNAPEGDGPSNRRRDYELLPFRVAILARLIDSGFQRLVMT
jgi:hypothetical protein